MTAVQIIDEIKHLAPGERARVISFVRGLDEAQQLSGPELAELAGAMVRATDPAEAQALKERIAAGFYGGQTNA